jgi:hypothetical protein
MADQVFGYDLPMPKNDLLIAVTSVLLLFPLVIITTRVVGALVGIKPKSA